MNADRPSSDLVALSHRALDPEDAFNTLLAHVRRDVDARLAGYLDARVADAVQHGADVEAMADAIRTLTLRGGKRLRAALVAVGYLSEDDSLPQEIALDVRASAATRRCTRLA
jgi:geranylgeranyl pyrophosphate synthase